MFETAFNIIPHIRKESVENGREWEGSGFVPQLLKALIYPPTTAERI